MSKPKQSPEMMNDLLALSHVPRWVIVSTSRPQSVAEHSFRVAIILLEICKRIGVGCEQSTLQWALMHDGAESRTGDLPMGIDVPKDVEYRECPWLEGQQVYARGRILVKLADLVETATWISRWGVGPHATSIAIHLRRYTIEQARLFSFHPDCGYTGLDILIEQIMDDITSEIGRFREV